MTLTRIYRRSVVYPGIIEVGFIIAYPPIDRDYKSEWMTSESLSELAFIPALVYWVLICLLALPIFLNRYPRVSSDNILSVLSWFLLPGGFICALLIKVVTKYSNAGSIYEIAYTITYNLPFVAGLIWGFWKYRRLRTPIAQ